jgi:hypothetical protein
MDKYSHTHKDIEIGIRALFGIMGSRIGTRYFFLDISQIGL